MASIQSTILEFWIRRLNLFSAKKIGPQVLRARIDQMAAKSKPNRNVQVVPVDAASVPAEWLIPRGAPQDRVLMYIHGGAWFMGSTNTHRALVSRLAHAGGIRALSINYRLAPEHPFPAGLEDCITAYDWLLQSGIAADKISVALRFLSVDQSQAVLRNRESIFHFFEHQTDAAICAVFKKRINLLNLLYSRFTQESIEGIVFSRKL